MPMNKKMLAMAVAAVLLGAVLIVGYFAWQNSNYVTTIDARIDAAKVNIMPYTSGQLTSWSGSEGQDVLKGDKLGTVDGGVTSSGIVTPINGKLIKVNVTEGQSVSTAQTVAVVADMNDLFVSANIEETKVSQLAVGQGVEIVLDAFPGQVFLGKIEVIGQAAASVFSAMSSTSSNGNYTKITQLIPIKIVFIEDYQQTLKLGMNAEIKIHIKSGVANGER